MAQFAFIIALIASVAAIPQTTTTTSVTSSPTVTSRQGSAQPSSSTSAPSGSVSSTTATNTSTISYLPYFPTFPPVPQGTQTVRALFVGKVSIIAVAENKTTYSYLCDTPYKTLTAGDTYDEASWDACDDPDFRTAIYTDSPSQYAFHYTSNWNTKTKTGIEHWEYWPESNIKTIADVWTTIDSISHSVSATLNYVADISNGVKTAEYSVAYTASGITPEESAALSASMLERKKYSRSYQPSDYVTMGPVAVVSGAEKLAKASQSAEASKKKSTASRPTLFCSSTIMFALASLLVSF